MITTMSKPKQRSFCTWLQINGDWYKVGFAGSGERVQLTKYIGQGSEQQIESQYWVCLNPQWCECPDFIKHEGQKKCKHLACLEKLCEALRVTTKGPQELIDVDTVEAEITELPQ